MGGKSSICISPRFFPHLGGIDNYLFISMLGVRCKVVMEDIDVNNTAKGFLDCISYKRVSQSHTYTHVSCKRDEYHGTSIRQTNGSY
jgi:hypothetical protein